MRKSYLLFFLLIVLFQSCDFFRTRTPEAPNESNINYPPPTTPQTLMDNFLKSFNQKNLTMYQSCFDISSAFHFYPSSDALAIYSNIFQSWNITSEISFAKNLFSKFSNQEFPSMTFTTSSISYYSTDSTVFIADYEVSINSRDNSINNLYKGTSQFVLVINNSGLWNIVRWYDFNKQMDNFQTISFLKAKLY